MMKLRRPLRIVACTAAMTAMPALVPSLDASRMPLAVAVAQTSTVTGTIVATREGAVRVEVPQGGDVEPAIGNAVQFTTEIRGVTVRAGNGEVAGIETGAVWVRVTGGRPSLGMTATIAATGRRGAAGGSVRTDGSTGTGSSGGTRAGAVPVGPTGVDPILARMRASTLSVGDKYLQRALKDELGRLDPAQLQRTPDGRARLAGFERLIESTEYNAVLAELMGEGPPPRRGLPPGVTESLADAAEGRILLERIAGIGHYLSDHLINTWMTPTEDAAQARQRLTGGHEEPSRALATIHQMWRAGATEQGLTIQAALRRLPEQARQAVAAEQAEFGEAFDRLSSSFSRFELALGGKTGDADTLALALYKDLHRFGDASSRLVEAAERVGRR